MTKTCINAQNAPSYDQDGARTGGLGYRTEDGQQVISGREKDVIVVSGRNIHPTEIERGVTPRQASILPPGQVPKTLSGKPRRGRAGQLQP
ncbi:hypothetical protein [Actinoplanes utahensis]|uniref:hypothetical protein n=1 Tax=Actinoplanes utahensis TaxID=1869 RepID=UPI001269D215|nr:hypothetical protein [Actinoplanes utahensis]GIF34571.1 hypothetical protein Aut01nite_75570 [Actinoplanes utahensis]